MNTALVVALSLLLLVLPIGLIIGLWRKQSQSKIDWLLTAVLTSAFVGYVLIVARWDFWSYYLRPLVALAWLAAVVVSLLRAWQKPWWTTPADRKGWGRLLTNVAISALFLGMLGLAVSGLAPRTAAVSMAMPLSGGSYYVGQGGAGTLVNYHHPNRAQAYAVDVIGLNSAGRGSDGLQPADPAAYAIWGAPVHSPCSGTVLEARSDLPDLRPPATDTDNVAGNHLVIRCAGTEPAVDVIVAHLQQDSLRVGVDDQVVAGQPLARVGNTGNTTEPHLHVHAVRTGTGNALTGDGVPIRFDGDFLVRNDVIVGG